ncbi:MAG: Rdx family protein [Haloferacaceae archaeon]
MTDIEIEYCVPCGFLERAQEIQGQLLRQFGRDLNSVALVTGEHGVLRVAVDRDVVFDKADDEYDLDAITRAVRERI